MTSHERAGLAFFTFDLLDRVDGLLSAVSTRCGGVSAKPFDSLNLGFRVADDPASVLENRRRFAGAVGFPLESVVATRQVHGAAVRTVPMYRDESWPCDGLVTRDRDVFLMGFSADCPLVLLADAESHAIGLAHCGWRSTVGGVVANAVRAMRDLGAQPPRIVAGISPGIGPCCYEVGGEVRDAAASAFGNAERFFRPHDAARPPSAGTSADYAQPGAAVPHRREKFILDLPALVGHAIAAEGVKGSNIETAELCTRCRQDLFFSHRGGGGRTGRLAAVIGWTAQTSPR